MGSLIGATEIWQIAVIKLLFCLFVGAGWLFYFKLKKPALFVALISIFLSLSYSFLIWEAKLTWWALQGDEIFVAANLEKMAAGQFFSDFFYAHLPPFYPPLYFWVIGFIGHILKFNGIQSAHLGVFAVLLGLPLAVYFLQKLFYRYFPGKKIENWKLVLITASIFVLQDWTAVFFKPFEFFSAILVIFWCLFLMQELNGKSLNWLKLLIYGVSGGLLFMTYYFWFFLAAIALALYKFFIKGESKYYYGNLFLIGLIMVVVSLPFTLPLLIASIKFGSENWQSGYFIPEYFDIYVPFLNFSFFGVYSLAGLLAMIFLWKKPEMKVLATILVSTYLWQLANFVGLIFFNATFLPAKPFLFFGGAIFSIAAAYGIGEIISEKIKNEKAMAGLFVLGWLILATQLVGGTFIDDKAVRNQLVEIKQPIREEFSNLISELKTIKGLDEITILSSGLPQLYAFLPLNTYISYNIHFSHPAANFSQRYYFIETLVKSQNPEQFYRNLQQAPFEKIDALLLLKGDGFYPFDFWLDAFPQGSAEKELRLPANLINEQYFVKVFEDKRFVFYQPKKF